LLLGLTHATRAQEPTEPSFTLKPVGPNAWAAIANLAAKVPAGGNAGFVIGDDGVAVIDTFASAEAAQLLLAEIRKRTSLPIKFVVNTHYHVDHVAGNGVFADAGAKVLAHRNVRGWIHRENLNLLGANITPELKAFIESFVAPTVGYDQGVDLYLGSRVIQVRSFPGHTGGDSVVLIPDARLAFAGDLFWRNILPNMIDGSTRPWIETLTTLAKSEAGYTFVPGHGDVGTTEDVAAFRDYLAALYKLVADARAQGRSGNALADAVMPQLTEKYGQWDFFKFLAPLNILQTEAELSGTKRIPQAQPGN
jgi:glyoxylase-like metal-dependent hydrolase (beta-lactamase superfamily II)